MTLSLRVVEDVAGEVAQALVVRKALSTAGLPSATVTLLGVALQRDRRRDAAAELHDEGVGRLP